MGFWISVELFSLYINIAFSDLSQRHRSIQWEINAQWISEFQPVAHIHPCCLHISFFCSPTSLSFPSFLSLFKRRAWKTSLLQKLWSGFGRGQAFSIPLVLLWCPFSDVLKPAGFHLAAVHSGSGARFSVSHSWRRREICERKQTVKSVSGVICIHAHVSESSVYISKGCSSCSGVKMKGGGSVVKTPGCRSEDYEVKPQHCQAATLGISSKDH